MSAFYCINFSINALCYHCVSDLLEAGEVRALYQIVGQVIGVKRVDDVVVDVLDRKSVV